jgi:hypothetical protein
VLWNSFGVCRSYTVTKKVVQWLFCAFRAPLPVIYHDCLVGWSDIKCPVEEESVLVFQIDPVRIVNH